MTDRDHTRTDYPAWVCSDCGQKWGRKQAGICTMHIGTCGICGQEEIVTEPRDWGHLRDGWQAEKGREWSGTEASRPVECANCGWKGKRMTGKTHDCPKCGAWVTFTGED